MKLVLVFLVALLAANSAMAQESKVLAVWPITDSSGKLKAKDLQAATNILRGLLARSAKYAVVDKSRQESKRMSVYKELKKESHEECYDQKCRIQLGQALSADNLLMCTNEALGSTCTLTCELVPLEREVAEFAAVTTFKCGVDGLGPALRKAAAQLTGEATVGERKTVRITPEFKGVVKSKSGIEMALVKAGTFMMGSPVSEPGRDNDETQHRVTITRDFHLGKTEVTQGQWKKVMGNNPSAFGSCGAECPVENVNWFEAVAFANAASKAEGLPQCYTLSGCNKSPGEDMECSSVSFKGLSCTGYRLPTEAEWEYAARAGTMTPFSTGRCLSTDQANYDGNYPQKGCSKGAHRKKTISVASFAANAWGLFDMHGNVSEWVWDWKDSYSSGSATDSLGPSSGSLRVYRGGSWGNRARRCQSALRSSFSPGYRYDFLGFRLARSAR